MGAGRWSRVKAVFQGALARAPAERPAFVRESCGADTALRAEVESLLAAHAEAGSVALRPGIAVTSDLAMAAASVLRHGDRFGPYEIVGWLGAGGMGEVHRARDTKLGREVAIKILPRAFTADAERLVRFEREARVLASLNHPHIATIYGLEEADGVRGLVLELVEGETLAECLSRGPLPVPEALRIAREIAEALEAAHDKSIVHRDLKPANIKITPEGTVKVLDFGLAKLGAGAEGADLSQAPTVTAAGTLDGVILGTAAYMSPEQARGKPADRRADIWAFGCVLYEMLAGRAAFPGETLSDTIAHILEREPAWARLPRDTPPSLRRLLRRCVDKDARRRLQAVGDARVEIENLLAGEQAEEQPGTAVHAPGWKRLFPWALVATLSVAVGVLLWSRRPEQSQPASTLRFTMLPPLDTVFAGTISHQAVSPDGRRIAFVAQRQAERNRLWVRFFDSLEAQPLAGTDGVTTILWSPDSEFLAFFADGRLKKVKASGGPVVPLCEAPGGILPTGTWARDTILFGPDARGGLSAAPAGGGVPTPVMIPDTAKAEVRHTFPDFLPDGDRFIYLSQPSNTVYLGSLSSPGTTEILRTDSKAVYAEPGYLLFVRQQVLFAQPFDEARAQLTGSPVALATPVGFNPFNGGGRFSVSDTGVLAYRGGDVGQPGELKWFDREGRSLGSLDRPRYYQALDLSPAGGHLTVAIADPPQPPGITGSEVWVLDTTRGGRVRVNPATSRSPVWSPDGREVAFTARRDDGRWGLFRALAGGGEVRLIHESDVQIDVTDWSPDAQTFVYTEHRPQSAEDIWLLPASSGGKPTPFVRTPAREGLAQFSPNGRRLAYVSNESGRREVYVRPVRGPGDRSVISADGGTAPRWRADTELVYVDAASRLVSVRLQTAGSTLEIGAAVPLFAVDMPPDSIFTETGWEPKYALSPDGQRVLVVSVSQQQASVPIVVVTNWWNALRQ